MSRYIDIDKAIPIAIQAVVDVVGHGISQVDAVYIAERLGDASTADVVEVRHGRWNYHECVSSYDGCISGYACSVCGAFVEDEDFEAEEFHKKFCGNCGAKMDGERREN